MESRGFDYAPLSRRTGLRARLATLAGNNLMIMGATVAGLLAGVPVIVVVVQLAGGGLGGFGWFCLVFLLPCGVWALLSVLAQGGKDARVGAFARVNRLELIRASSATHYAGSLFADGTHLVQQSVRTPGETFVEIGDRWPATAPRVSMNAATSSVRAAARTPELFLRGRLAGQVRPDAEAEQIVTPDLDRQLRRFAGSYRIEVLGSELTVFGTRRLDPTKAGRMEEAFGLVDRLVAAADADLVDDGDAERTLSGVTIPDLAETRAPRGRRMSALKVVGLTIAMMVVVPLLIAAVLSLLEDRLRGHEGAAQMVVWLVILVVGAIVAWIVRLITTPHKPNPGKAVLISAVVVIGVVGMLAWAIATDDEVPSAAPETRAAAPSRTPAPSPTHHPATTGVGERSTVVDSTGCGRNARCKAEVAQLNWFEQQHFTAADHRFWGRCPRVSHGRSECAIAVKCRGGVARLTLVFEGPQRAIVGVRSSSTQLAVSRAAVHRLAQDRCTPA